MSWGFSNTGGGTGLSRTDALLRVQAPAGSVVTIVKGSYHKSDIGHENSKDHSVYDYYFIIHASQFDSENPWTVTATYLTAISVSQITITKADEYDLIMEYTVPVDYQQVEYLQSSGSQWITSGWTQPSNWQTDGLLGIVEADFMLLSSQRANYITGRSWQNDYGWGSEYEIGLEYSTPMKVKYGFSYEAMLNFSMTASLNTRYKVSTRSTNRAFQVYVNDALKTSVTSAGQARSGSPLYLFTSYGDNTYRFVSARIYHFLVSKNGESIVDLYPCYRRSDSVAGMWDRVNKVFRTNSGSGTFIVGPNI